MTKLSTGVVNYLTISKITEFLIRPVGTLSLSAKTGLGMVVTLLLYCIIKREQAKQRLIGAPPGSLGLWGIGEMIPLLKSRVAFDLERMRKYGLNYTTHILLEPTIRLGTVEDRRMLQRSEQRNQSKMSWPSAIQTILGKTSLSVVSGIEHTQLRSMFTSTFSPEILKSYIKAMDNSICEYLQRLNDGKAHSTEEFENLMLHILVQTAFGGNIEPSEVDKLSGLFRTVMKGFVSILPFDVPFTVFGAAMNARREIMKMISVCIDRIEARCENVVQVDSKNAKVLDVLTKFIQYRDESGKRLTREQVSENVLLLLIAGHDSTAASIGTLLGLLFDEKHDDVMKKLRQEMQSIQPLDDDSLKRNEYLNAVIDEALRYLTPANSTYREATQDIILSDGYIVPKGVRMSTFVTAGHLNEAVWGKHEYNPDRMLSIKKEKSEVFKDYFYPFGGGNRHCPGEQFSRLEMRLFLYRIAREWRLNISQSKTKWFPLQTIVSEFTLEHIA